MKNKTYLIILVTLIAMGNIASGQSATTSTGGYYTVINGVEYYVTAPAPQSDNSASNNAATWDASNYSYDLYNKPFVPIYSKKYYREHRMDYFKQQEAIYIDTTAYNYYLNKDYQKAFELYHKNFKTLYPDGYRTLGYLYEMGWGTMIDYFEAVKCYKLAAEQGDNWGELYYGIKLNEGLGIEKDPAEAARWFTLSALQENPYGRNGLEWMMHNNKDISAAAISMGHIKPYETNGLQLLTWIFTWDRGVYSVDTAIAGYKRRAALGDTTAQVVIGEYFENGNTGTQGRDSAKYWYEKAWAKHCVLAAQGIQDVNRDGGLYEFTTYSGVHYYGYFKEGLFDGGGTMSMATKTWYGTWSEGKLIHGTYKCPEGTYEGDWKDDKINGHGKWTYYDSTKYEGELKNGQWYGEGVYTYNKGFKQYATYVNNKPMDCKYKNVFPNGNIEEEGVYVDSLKEGKVTQYYEDGKVHQVINYTKGLVNGNFKGYYRNGVLRVDCEYKNGRLWNITVYNKPDGTSTGSSFKDGTGEVKWYYDDGNLQSNDNYKNGVQDGNHKVYYDNGKLWSEYIYQDGKLWTTIVDNMPDGTPTGSNVKDGNGVTMQQSNDGTEIIGKTTWENGIAIKSETFSAK